MEPAAAPRARLRGAAPQRAPGPAPAARHAAGPRWPDQDRTYRSDRLCSSLGTFVPNEKTHHVRRRLTRLRSAVIHSPPGCSAALAADHHRLDAGLPVIRPAVAAAGRCVLAGCLCGLPGPLGLPLPHLCGGRAAPARRPLWWPSGGSGEEGCDSQQGGKIVADGRESEGCALLVDGPADVDGSEFTPGCEQRVPVSSRAGKGRYPRPVMGGCTHRPPENINRCLDSSDSARARL